MFHGKIILSFHQTIYFLSLWGSIGWPSSVYCRRCWILSSPLVSVIPNSAQDSSFSGWEIPICFDSRDTELDIVIGSCPSCAAWVGPHISRSGSAPGLIPASPLRLISYFCLHRVWLPGHALTAGTKAHRRIPAKWDTEWESSLERASSLCCDGRVPWASDWSASLCRTAWRKPDSRPFFLFFFLQ